LFKAHDISGVIHFAGLKAVGESVAKPLQYFDNNLGSTFTLLQAMDRANVRRVVFSSSATVYGDPDTVPITESAKLQVTNPYGRTKLMCEQMLEDMRASNPAWKVAVLRYFNPVGAHHSGQIGESPNGIPNNLMPYVTQVAVGKREKLSIFGNDYPTIDGTGVRDYIHVCDLADAHRLAMEYLDAGGESRTLNCGYGRGFSVREVLDTVEQVSFGPFVYHIGRGELRSDGEPVKISERERDILTLLATRPGQTVPREDFAAHEDISNERTVDVQINRLRRKIEADPANPTHLQTVRGVGYRLVAT
jgi:UDP-glucose 4-epimerase